MVKKSCLLCGIFLLFLSGCTAATSPVPSPVPTTIPSATSSPVSPPIPGGKYVVGYYPSWAPAHQVAVKEIPAARLSHINYAFSNVSQDGQCVLGDPAADVQKVYTAAESVNGKDDPASLAFHGNFNQLIELKQQYPDLKVLISIGGWTYSANFSAAAQDGASRKRFASSCIDLYLRQYPGVFDGLDIDWEYPVNGGLVKGKAEDKKNYTLLLAEIRQQLDELGKADNRRYLLTIAAPAGPVTIRNFELVGVAGVVDWMNLMGYDLHGTWEQTTNFSAPLFRPANDPGDPGLDIDSAVQTYLSSGVPAQKIVLGIPFYGHGWAGVAAAGNGLYQHASGAAPGTWEAGSFDFKDISANYLPAYPRFWNAEAYVPWLFNPEKGIFITYEDPQSLQAKAGYAKDQGLAGIMIWELSQGNESLFDAIDQGLAAGGPLRPTPAPTVDVPRPYEAQIHSISKINLDGKLDDWPAKPDFVLNDAAHVVYRLSPNSWGGPQDLSAEAWAGWTPDGLYFAFKVVDDVHVQLKADTDLWHGDHVELQVDTQLAKDYSAATMNDDDYQIGLSVGNYASVPPVAFAWFNGPGAAGPAGKIQMAYTRTEDGYILEAFVPKEVLSGLTLAEGAVLGMNISASDTDKESEGQKVMLSTSPTRTYKDPRTFGKITLVK